MATATTTTKTSLLQNATGILPDSYREVWNITTIAAAGTAQSNGTLIGGESPFVQISNNTASNGVVLPTASFIGQQIWVYPQLATNAPKVYPPVGGTINSGTANASVASTARKVVQYIAVDRTGLNYVTIGL